MSSGRGRGYGGRHREPRPGFPDDGIRLPDPRPEPIPKPEMLREDRSEDKEPKPEYPISLDDEAALKELLTIDEQYRPLLVLLEQFAPGEDGIQFNRKLRHFESTVTTMCPDEVRLQRAFHTLHAAALQRPSVAQRLSTVGACFTRQQRQQSMRIALLNVMQGVHSKLYVLERANPTYLVNAANVMGDYFTEARLCNGNKVHILAEPLVHYMKALLDSDDIRAHRSLATQLMQNGRELLSHRAQDLDNLSISIRLRLLSPPLPNIIWLVLSADLCLMKFLPLPNTLQQFYAAHLELSTDDSYSEVNYGSWKNTSPEKGTSEQENVSLNVSQLNLSHDEDGKPKLRPILGAGARVLRQEQASTAGQESFESWASKNEFAKTEYTIKNDHPKEYNKSSLSKRYDLNSWRQNEEETKEDDTVFNPSVLPPNIPSNIQYNTVPDYPPPNLQATLQNRFKNYENLPNYLQQGDGPHIQSYNSTNYNQGDYVPNEEIQTKTSQYHTNEPQGDFNRRQSLEDPSRFTQTQSEFKQFPERSAPEKVNNEVQKSSRRQVENWRRDKFDVNEDTNRNRPKNWTRQRSKESLYEEDAPAQEGDSYQPRLSREPRPGNRTNHRNSSEHSTGGGMSRTSPPPPRRHVSEVPRSNEYWDHDDRCDRDY